MDEQQLLARMRRRILLDAAALCLVPVVWGVLRALGAYWRPMPDFMRGFQEGALMGLALVMVFCTARDLSLIHIFDGNAPALGHRPGDDGESRAAHPG